MAGPALRVHGGPRAVFSRALLLFDLSEAAEEDGGRDPLSAVLLAGLGRVAFPRYTVCRAARIFQDRDDLIRSGPTSGSRPQRTPRSAAETAVLFCSVPASRVHVAETTGGGGGRRGVSGYGGRGCERSLWLRFPSGLGRKQHYAVVGLDEAEGGSWRHAG